MELVSSLRKFVKGVLLVCLVVTAVLTVLVASLSLWTWYKTAQVENFYRENRLLGKMRAGQMDSTNDSAPARKVLLEIVPLGTDREAAVAGLRREGLGCQTIAEPVTDTVAPTLPRGSWLNEHPQRGSDQKRLRRLSSDDP
jgi:hypothetical protein